MSALLVSSPEIRRLSDLLDRLGGIPAERVRYYPLPGTATEQDVLDIQSHEDRYCELVNGVLVEKPMGYEESFIAILIATMLNNFVIPRKLGVVTGEGGMMRLFPGLVRIPDVAFASWSRFPDGRLSGEPIPALAPDLVVEVLSVSNTRKEMDIKRSEYFEAGVRLVWMIDHRSRTATIYKPNADPVTLIEGQTLVGDPVLPGFTLPVSDLFSQLQFERTAIE